MQSAAALLFNGLGKERGKQAVLRRDSLHGRAERHEIVGRLKRGGAMKIHLILPRSLFVMGALRAQAHFLQGQADAPADVLPMIEGRHIEIARLVIRLENGLSPLVGGKQVKLTFRAKLERNPLLHRFALGLPEQETGVPLKGPAVRIPDGAVEAGHTALRGSPRENRQRIGIRKQEQIGLRHIAEARNGGSVKGNTFFKGVFEIRRQNGDVFLNAEDIAKCQPDKLDIVFLHKLQNIRNSLCHRTRSPFVGRAPARPRF